MPRARRLAQAVQRALEVPDLAGRLEAGRRLHVDGLVEHAVEEGRLDVDLVQLVVVERDGREQGAQRRVLADGRKALVVVDAGALEEALGHNARLVAHDVAVGVVLVDVHPLERQRLVARRQVHDLVHIVGDERVYLVLHGLGPVGGVGRGDGLAVRRRRLAVDGGGDERGGRRDLVVDLAAARGARRVAPQLRCLLVVVAVRARRRRRRALRRRVVVVIRVGGVAAASGGGALGGRRVEQAVGGAPRARGGDAEARLVDDALGGARDDGLVVVQQHLVGVALVRVADEDAGGRVRRELVARGGDEDARARAEDAQRGEVGLDVEGQLPRRRLLAGGGGAVAQERGGLDGLGPERERQFGVEEHRLGLLDERAVEALGGAVLLRRVGHGRLVVDALGGEVAAQRVVDVLGAVVAAHGDDAAAELRLQVVERADQRAGGLSLVLEHVHDAEAGVAIEHGEHVLGAAAADDGQRPAEVGRHELERRRRRVLGAVERRAVRLGVGAGLAQRRVELAEGGGRQVDAGGDRRQLGEVVAAEVAEAGVPERRRLGRRRGQRAGRHRAERA